jgi:hypothetical protein
MRRAEEVLDTLYNFTESQKAKLEALAAEIKNIKDQKISIETYNTLYNCVRELDALRDNVTIRLIASLKRGDILS